MYTNSNPAISVIIPVYNGALYIERTLNSLLSQSFVSFEIICINDGSTDDSLIILESFAKNNPRVRIFSKLNGGTATNAIIYGLKYATGRYFMYSSQDDLFSVDLLEKTYSKAEYCNADAVVPNMDYYWGDNVFSMGPTGIHGINGDRTRELSGREAFVLSLDWTIHGFALWNMDIVKKIGFYEYGLSSDEYASRMFFFNCKKVVFSEGTFYYRQNNPQAITKKWNINQLDYFETCKRLEQFAVENGFSSNDISKIHGMLLSELIRVQNMFNENIEKISIKERIEIGNKIKQTYNENIRNIRLLGAIGIKQKIKNKIMFSGYDLFKFWCKTSQLRKLYHVILKWGKNSGSKIR